MERIPSITDQRRTLEKVENGSVGEFSHHGNLVEEEKVLLNDLYSRMNTLTSQEAMDNLEGFSKILSKLEEMFQEVQMMGIPDHNLAQLINKLNDMKEYLVSKSYSR